MIPCAFLISLTIERSLQQPGKCKVKDKCGCKERSKDHNTAKENKPAAKLMTSPKERRKEVEYSNRPHYIHDGHLLHMSFLEYIICDVHIQLIDPTTYLILKNAYYNKATGAYADEWAINLIKQQVINKDWERFDFMLLPTTPTIYRLDEVRDGYEIDFGPDPTDEQLR